MTPRARRIVVALDASPASAPAVEAAAQLAATWHAEILGIFVEDANLLRWASLPFTREVSGYTASVRDLGELELVRELRAQASRARTVLTRAAERHHVRMSFRVARGAVTAELLATLTEHDVVSLGRGGRRRGMQLRMGSTARTLACESVARVLVLPTGSRLAPLYGVVFDGTEGSRQATIEASELAGATPLIVLAVGAGPDDQERLERDARAVVPERTDLRVHYLSRRSLDVLPRLAHSAGVNTLVVPGPGPHLSSTMLQTLMETFPGPVLVIPCPPNKEAADADVHEHAVNR